ncbi:hypothetical protein M5X00_05480 [Paenibacillus alvei]|uniref:hypothetical protein n=1 Tax=Paenibacillus alvei TaxID=44250 RepID=UPI000287D13F|nr:hypothetical protein [Paenibacillus alvei]EJW19386.1 hypothetical protein PAV_1c03600 [Paenibacillus alvei DSM 29]MCY9542823.1 hypothetical protein [Paenibacillus alvei]MCY9707347.1 hypothetical protein [Paenibacillus alvei]MCY9737599.1 hypothetical protein [Paenibacillus alvei]MCY9753708.1 hypothetical protein [Paenibacillus alvei]
MKKVSIASEMIKKRATILFMVGILSITAVFSVVGFPKSAFASSALQVCLNELPPFMGPPAPNVCPSETAKAPTGVNGELVKFKKGNYKEDMATAAIAAAALSTLLKVPYSTILAAFSAAAGFNASDVYYTKADYRVWGYGTFSVIRIYSNSTYSKVLSISEPAWTDL